MATKKEPTIADRVAIFKDVMRRSSITDLEYINNVFHAKNAKDASVLIIVDETLWNAIFDDEELKPHISALDLDDPENHITKDRLLYIQDMDKDWIEINPESMYNGDVIEIAINGFKYSIPLNKGLFPTKLKKAEFNNFGYKLYTQPRLAISIKKKFEGPVEDSSFTIVRIFQIL